MFSDAPHRPWMTVERARAMVRHYEIIKLKNNNNKNNNFRSGKFPGDTTCIMITVSTTSDGVVTDGGSHCK